VVIFIWSLLCIARNKWQTFYFDRRLYVGDVVVLKNPEKPEDYLVRRLAATEGYEMASTDEKDESFVLEKDQCWVVAENEKLKAKV